MMVKNSQTSLIAAILLVAGLAAPGVAAEGPPISGSVQNFTVYDEPIPAPDTPFATREDGDKTLESLRGKVVLVNFWATWCGPCIRELPSLNALQTELGGDDFAVALFSQDRGGWKQVVPFLKRLKITDIEDSFLDEKLKLSKALAVRSLPVSLILDAEGNEVGRVAGAAEWDTPEALALIQYYLDKAAAAQSDS